MRCRQHRGQFCPRANLVCASQTRQLTVFPCYLFIFPLDLNMKHICDIPLLGFWGRFNVSVVVQSLSCVQVFASRWAAAYQASLSFTISQDLLKLISIESLCHPTTSPSVTPFPPALNLSHHQGFSNELALSIR